MTKQVDQQDIEKLKEFDTPTICNVIESFGVRPQTEGFLPASIKALFGEMPPMVGYAVTVTFRSATKPQGQVAYGDLGKHVDQVLKVPGPRVVVIQDIDNPPLAASSGEMMGSLYAACDCVGMITNGFIRDATQLRKRGFPVFSAGTCCSHGYPQFLEMNVPVEIEGVKINPGDLLHGDGDGVVIIPIELVPQIVQLAPKLAKSEQEFFDYVDSGQITAEGVSQAAAKVGKYPQHN